MKFLNIITVILFCNFINAQEIKPELYTAHNKGKIFVSWGGNKDYYSNSDINFRGKDYDFTIYNTKANDAYYGWHLDYVNPTRLSIPQNNYRIGYFITDHYYIAIGSDHMKYIVTQNQKVRVNGFVGNSYPNFKGTYTNQEIDISDGKFLTFEHTDGLNYVNAEVGRMDDLSKYIGITNTDKIQINVTEGIGFGILYPKTNSKILEKDRHDEFHVSGYGLSAKAGLNFTIFKHFFIQTELKGGYINMPGIRTTYDGDKASQSFFFLQKIVAFGGIFKL